MRAVADTNVLIAAALFAVSTPRAAVDFLRDAHELAFSTDTFAEFEETLLRPKFDRYLSPVDRFEFIAMLHRGALWVTPNERIATCRDPRDDKFLEVAVAANAGFIVTGDADLLTLDSFRGIRIVRPAALVAALRR